MTESSKSWPGDLDDRGRFESRQERALVAPVVAATDAGARELGRRYWREVGAVTFGLLSVVEHQRGTEIRLAGRFPLLRFAPLRTAVEGARVACVYEIRSGLLVSRAGGALSVEQLSGSPPRLAVVVTGYRPRLASAGRWLYLGLQAPVHRAVSRRFLATVADGASA